MIKLNLGCGGDYKKDFVNVDVRFDVYPDVVSNLNNLPFTNNYADYILCQDVLEHFCYLELQEVLAEIYRVLKPKGTLEIRCPDAERIIDKYKTGEYDIDKVLMYLFGGIDYVENTHKIGFTKKGITEMLKKFGFRVTKLEDADVWSNMLCICTK